MKRKPSPQVGRGSPGPSPVAKKRASLLTPREHQFMRLLSQGLENKAIAEAMGITVNTVEWYEKKVYPKLVVHNRTAAAYQYGLLVQKEAAPSSKQNRPRSR